MSRLVKNQANLNGLTINHSGTKFKTIFWLTIRDLLYDRKISVCIITSLMAVITPLLLLFSLKYGVVSVMQEQLIRDPRNMELVVIGNRSLDGDFFNWLKQQPELGFAIPLTRSLNLEAALRKDDSHFIDSAEIIPTAPGDPLLQNQWPLNDINEVVLSTAAMQKLGVKVGDSFRLITNRTLDSKRDTVRLELKVAGIIPERYFGRAAIFANLDLVIMIENFRDGYKIDYFNINEGKPVEHEKTIFAKARIYTKDIDSVKGLSDKLAQKNIEIDSKAAEIEKVKLIDQTLNYLFGIIAITSVIGCIVSLIGAFLSNVDRKRKDLAFLQLLGFNAKTIVSYLICQAVVLSGMAFAVATLLYLIVRQILNSKFDLSSLNLASEISRLSPSHLLIALSITLFIAIVVAIIGGLQAIKIHPAENLREI